jgi:hypothetical protein
MLKMIWPAITAQASMVFRSVTGCLPADSQSGDILLSGGAQLFIQTVHPHTTDSFYPDRTGLFQEALPRRMEFQFVALRIKGTRA